MQAIQHNYAPAAYTSGANKSLVTKFMAWCAGQENNRILWLAIMITLHGCVLTPVALYFIMAAGTSMLLFAFVIAAMAMSVVVNLAALPAKVTIPVFFLSLLIDLIVIASCIIMGLSHHS